MVGSDRGHLPSMRHAIGRTDQDDLGGVLGSEQTVTQAAAPLSRGPRRLHLGIECAVHPGAQDVPEGDQVGMGGRLQRGPLLLMPAITGTSEISGTGVGSKGLTGADFSRPLHPPDHSHGEHDGSHGRN